MKKTLVALAAMTAMCGASATSVTLYGVVDTGFAYNSVNTDDFAGLAGQGGDSFSMESGQRSGSRFGMKGVEDLGNGLQVGFVLENGFSTDTGADGGNAFFDRESSLYLEGSFGKFGMGRLLTTPVRPVSAVTSRPSVRVGVTSVFRTTCRPIVRRVWTTWSTTSRRTLPVQKFG